MWGGVGGFGGGGGVCGGDMMMVWVCVHTRGQ